MKAARETDDRIAEWIRQYRLEVVFLVALTPRPDTPIVILAGLRKPHFKRLLTVEVADKSTLNSVGAVVGGTVYGGLEASLGAFVASWLMVAGSLVFCLAVTWGPSKGWIFGWAEKMFSFSG